MSEQERFSFLLAMDADIKLRRLKKHLLSCTCDNPKENHKEQLERIQEKRYQVWLIISSFLPNYDYINQLLD